MPINPEEFGYQRVGPQDIGSGVSTPEHFVDKFGNITMPVTTHTFDFGGTMGAMPQPKPVKSVEERVIDEMPAGGFTSGAEYNRALVKRAREAAGEQGIDLQTPEGQQWYQDTLQMGMSMAPQYVAPHSKDDFIETGRGLFNTRTGQYVDRIKPQQPVEQPPVYTNNGIQQVSNGAPQPTAKQRTLADVYRDQIAMNEQIIREFPGTKDAMKAAEDNIKIQEKISADAQKKKDQARSDKKFQMEEDEYNRKKKKEEAEKAQFDNSMGYQTEKADRTLSIVSDLKKRVGKDTVSVGGSILKNIPGTPAKDFESDLKSLKAQLSFNELQAMRNASKTGGALGQTSDRELGLLESAMASLEQDQSEKNILKNLDIIEKSMTRWKESVNNYSSENKSSQVSGKVKIQLPNGRTGFVPKEKLQDALSRGAKQI